MSRSEQTAQRAIVRQQHEGRLECRGSIFVVRLQAKPGVDPIRALRGGLKALGRRYGLRAVAVSEEPD
jgi:hypothetical protein